MDSRARRNSPKSFDEGLHEKFVSTVFGYLDSFEDHPAVDYLRKEVTSKFLDPSVVSVEDRRAAAIAKWLKQEDHNRSYNLISHKFGGSDTLAWCENGNHLTRQLVTSQAASVIARVIGDKLPEGLFDSFGEFTSGASTGYRRSKDMLNRKYEGASDVTALCLAFIKQTRTVIPTGAIRPTTVPGNILFTVPKRTDIDRVACKEPDLNCYMQKGIGNFIRHRLKRFGINLDDQTKNQRLAQFGSLTGSLATIDLSSASDSLTIACARELLPYEWFVAVMATRSPYTSIDGDLHRNSMLSSMGNGFTFELETLIFYALGESVRRLRGNSDPISVYGDDIIVGSSISDDVISVLSAYGFTPNVDKTFSTGPFRESCGKHYYAGNDISPFYVRKKIQTWSEFINLTNKFRAWLLRTGLHWYDTRGYEAWLRLAREVPRPIWGGHDTDDPTLLVAPGRPIARLVDKGVTRKTSHSAGGYLHWFDATKRRTGGEHNPCVEVSSFSQEKGKLSYVRIAKCDWVAFLTPVERLYGET